MVDKAISFLLGALAVGFMSVLTPVDKPKGGTEVLRTQIAPKQCLQLGGRIEYREDEVYQGVRGCWVRGTEP